MTYKLADGSLSTDYEVGDEFYDAAGNGIFGLSCASFLAVNALEPPAGMMLFCSKKDSKLYHLAWRMLTPTPETKRKAEARKKPFTKSDLKDGMRLVVESRENEFYVIGGCAITYEHDSEGVLYHVRLGKVTGDMVTEAGKKILKVTDRDGTVLFERKPEKRKVTLELTEEQEAQIKKDLGL